MQKNKITKHRTQEEIKTVIKSIGFSFTPKEVLSRADEEINTIDSKEASSNDKKNITQAMTIFEFENSGLLATAVLDEYRTFASTLTQNLQKEFACINESEKSLAHIVSLNYVRVFEIQTKITNYLRRGDVTSIGVGYLNLLSKELDRAERHYLTSLQTLRMLKMPQLEVNIKTQNAFVGNSQVLQKNEIN